MGGRWFFLFGLVGGNDEDVRSFEMGCAWLMDFWLMLVFGLKFCKCPLGSYDLMENFFINVP